MMTHTALVAVLNKTLVSALNSRLERKDHGGKYFKMFSSSKQVKIKRELMKITVIVFFFLQIHGSVKRLALAHSDFLLEGVCGKFHGDIQIRIQTSPTKMHSHDVSGEHPLVRTLHVKQIGRLKLFENAPW